MKQANNNIAHRVLLRKEDSQQVFSINHDRQVSILTNPFSFEFLSNLSPVMRMCCCCMSC